MGWHPVGCVWNYCVNPRHVVCWNVGSNCTEHTHFRIIGSQLCLAKSKNILDQAWQNMIRSGRCAKEWIKVKDVCYITCWCSRMWLLIELISLHRQCFCEKVGRLLACITFEAEFFEIVFRQNTCISQNVDSRFASHQLHHSWRHLTCVSNRGGRRTIRRWHFAERKE